MTLTTGQWISIILVILGVNVASTAQLTDLLGPTIAKDIVSASGILMSIMAGVQGILAGQSGQIKAVQAMPGVESIQVNSKANQTLAQMAVDPAQPKIDIKPGADVAVNATAKG